MNKVVDELKTGKLNIIESIKIKDILISLAETWNSVVVIQAKDKSEIIEYYSLDLLDSEQYYYEYNTKTEKISEPVKQNSDQSNLMDELMCKLRTQSESENRVFKTSVINEYKGGA